MVLNTAAFLPPAGKRIPLALHLARSRFPGQFLVRGANLFLRSTLRVGACGGRLAKDVLRAYHLPYRSWRERAAIYHFVEDIPIGPRHPSHATLRGLDESLTALSGKPMLICWGMRDFVFDEKVLDEWISRFPAAEVERFGDAGHLVFEDAHGPLEPRIAAFLGAAAP